MTRPKPRNRHGLSAEFGLEAGRRENDRKNSYPGMTIARNVVRSKFGEKVAEQISDEVLSDFASALECLVEHDDAVWQEWLEEGGIDLSGGHA